jgi:hypothetical protein
METHLLSESVCRLASVGTREHRHDTGINDTEVLDLVDAKSLVDNTTEIEGHHGRSTSRVVVTGAEALGEPSSKLLVGLHIRAGSRLNGTQLLERSLKVVTTVPLDHLNQNLTLDGVGQGTVVHDRAGTEGVGGVNVDGTTAEGLVEDRAGGTGGGVDVVTRPNGVLGTHGGDETAHLSSVALGDGLVGVGGEVRGMVLRLKLVGELIEAVGRDCSQREPAGNVAESNGVRAWEVSAML